ncbi:MAG: type sorting protein [Bacteroidota bacterium]|nr:type sorting protein [Bacteroidota bacterium]
MKNPNLFVKVLALCYLFNGTAIFAQNASRTIPQNTSRVSWMTFTATQSANKVSLRWSTASESHTTAFAVQRSIDSVYWGNLGTVTAAGNSSSIQKYSYDDLAPAKGVNYYRLLEQNTTDRNTYSRVIRIDVITRTRDFTAFPNPATDLLELNGEPGTAVEAYNLNGDLVLQKTLDGDNEVDISQWRKGWYILRSGEQVVKLVVK